MVRRQRKCLRCGLKYWTYERRADDPDELWQAALDDMQQEIDGAECRLQKIAAFVKEMVLEPVDADGRTRTKRPNVNFVPSERRRGRKPVVST